MKIYSVTEATGIIMGIENTICITTSDENLVEVDHLFIRRSKTLLKLTRVDTTTIPKPPIRLPTITHSSLRSVIEWCQRYENRPTKTEQWRHWESQFYRCLGDRFTDILWAARWLRVHPMLRSLERFRVLAEGEKKDVPAGGGMRRCVARMMLDEGIRSKKVQGDMRRLALSVTRCREFKSPGPSRLRLTHCDSSTTQLKPQP